jgi:hypothetical protein
MSDSRFRDEQGFFLADKYDRALDQADLMRKREDEMILPVSARSVDGFIIAAVSRSINQDLIDAAQNLLNYAIGKEDVPMYMLANARNAIDEARKMLEGNK